jgi:phage/plasmid-like protein (TIGR03299 family)
MAHEIFGTRFAERQSDRPAWHGIAKAIFERTQQITATEALKSAGISYEVRRLPAIVGWTNSDGSITPIDTGMVGLVREPTTDDPEPRVLGTATSDYELVQNYELAEMIDPVAAYWPVETVGALRQGAITFFTLDVGQFGVKGEGCRQYLLVDNGFDGGHGLNVRQTGIRVVCANTLRMSESSNSFTVKLAHRSGIKAEAKFYIELVAQLRRNIEGFQRSMQALGETRITGEQVKGVIDATYPLPTKPQKLVVTDGISSDAMTADMVQKILADREFAEAEFKRMLDRTEALRMGGYQLYDKLCDEFPGIAGTAWAAYNAVTELATWREGPQADSALMFGVRSQEIQRAYDAVAKLVVA